MWWASYTDWVSRYHLHESTHLSTPATAANEARRYKYALALSEAIKWSQKFKFGFTVSRRRNQCFFLINLDKPINRIHSHEQTSYLLTEFWCEITRTVIMFVYRLEDLHRTIKHKFFFFKYRCWHRLFYSFRPYFSRWDSWRKFWKMRATEGLKFLWYYLHSISMSRLFSSDESCFKDANFASYNIEITQSHSNLGLAYFISLRNSLYTFSLDRYWSLSFFFIWLGALHLTDTFINACQYWIS